MTTNEWTYVVFGIILTAAVIFDLGLLSKKGKPISIRKAFYQTLFWVILALAFAVFIWYEQGRLHAIEYVSAYLMEWSLSIDNIFVFILIFTFFGIDQRYYGRVLLLGILMAIVFRIIFITVGIALVARFSWILYIFGGFLVYTGFKMFFVEQDDQYDPDENKVYKFLRKVLPITTHESGKYTMRIRGKRYFTMLFVVVMILASTDIVFALDSIPAVFAITQSKVIIYTSNIFAVLGLRSLFFLLKGAVKRFDYLQHGIAFVLVFIGAKMLVEYFEIHIPTWVSMCVIVVSIGSSILFSLYKRKIRLPKEK